MVQLIICPSLFREASLHDFGIRGHMFLIGGQIKSNFARVPIMQSARNFQSDHDALNFAEKHIRRRDRLFFCLCDSSFEFKRLKKNIYFF